jgi:hypothetical protein
VFARSALKNALRAPLRLAVEMFLGGVLAMIVVAAADAAEPPSAFPEALTAPEPSLPRGGSRDLYDGLVGSWDAEVVDHLPDGSDRRQSAEMHFAWVLEGRALQDLWIAPARRERQPLEKTPAPGNRYGTTLRVYDPKLDAWRITWINPVTGVETRLVGRRVGSQIIQTGSDADGRLVRWVFAELRRDFFHWRGETSVDGGGSWTCDTEFFARRRNLDPAPAAAARAGHSLRWEWTDRPGLEALSLEANARGTVAEGRALVLLDGVPVRVRYRVEHDAAWRFQAALIEASGLDAPRQVDIRRSAQGRWTVDGVPRPDLEGCEDVDLMATPYTNTPPLLAHPLAPGEARALRVAWVRFPDLGVRAVPQEYTRLETGAGAQRYRYRNLESGFTAELTLDDNGLVVDYGPWVRR